MSDPSITEKVLHRAGRAIGWRLLTRLIGLVSTLILVRLLEPGDIGLVENVLRRLPGIVDIAIRPIRVAEETSLIACVVMAPGATQA